MSEDSAAPTIDAPPDNLVDLIDGLVEPSEPVPIPLTPETWGWTALALLAVAGLAFFVRRYVVRRHANRYRRAALAALHRAETVSDVARVLRRTALTAYARADVAQLIGTEWIAFLSRTGREAFPEAAGEELSRAPYSDETAPASQQLRDAAEAWLRAHRPLAGHAGHGSEAERAA